MANFQFSSPLLRGFTHQEFSAGTAASTLLDHAPTPTRRVIVIVQNKSTTATIQVILSESGSSGILIPALGNISLDNYNGHIRVIASAADTPVHIAYSVV